jgi:hypothetical protein
MSDQGRAAPGRRGFPPELPPLGGPAARALLALLAARTWRVRAWTNAPSMPSWA